jgi:hypothetical protein
MSVKRPVLLFIVYCVGIVQYFISNIELYLRDCIRREIKAKEAEHASTLFIYLFIALLSIISRDNPF